MLPFSPLHITTALLEGLGSLSTQLIQGDKKTIELVTKLVDNSWFLCPTTPYITEEQFNDIKMHLKELLARCDTQSNEYKRFSYIIQYLWNYANPELNPFYYETISFEKGMSAYLLATGMSQFPTEYDDWGFELNKNLATSEGFVIYEDECLQLLYYPTKKKTCYQNPVFIVPPWINKYYIFDLSTHNSYISWLINQDIPVYCISWVNPDRTFSDQTLSDYITKGMQSAVTKAREQCGYQKLNMIGYCIGGIALLIYTGWHRAQKHDWIASLTFLATPFNFEKLDHLNVFVDEEHIKHVQNIVTDEGVFTGNRLMHAFSLLRTNDVLIQNIIDQIYHEKKQKPMDFLYWNADVTHIPSRVHIDYLRDVFLSNIFMKNPKMISGLAVDLDVIECPIFVLSTKKDYIVPWESSYEASLVLKNVTFCLGGSGHVVGIINPPHQKKYGYQTGETHGKSAKQWADDSIHHEGSWWTYWHTWVQPMLGKRIKSKQTDPNIIIESAPGRYALQKAPLI